MPEWDSSNRGVADEQAGKVRNLCSSTLSGCRCASTGGMWDHKYISVSKSYYRPLLAPRTRYMVDTYRHESRRIQHGRSAGKYIPRSRHPHDEAERLEQQVVTRGCSATVCHGGYEGRYVQQESPA